MLPGSSPHVTANSPQANNLEAFASAADAGSALAVRQRMTLRIVEESLEQGTLLRIAGDLSGSALSELETTCRNAMGPLTLDLEDVISVDEQGIVMLRSLAANGAKLVEASHYLSMRLGLDPSRDPDKDSGAEGASS